MTLFSLNRDKVMKLCNVSALFLLTCASPAILASEINAGDTAWILTATALVLFMTLPGLALFYGGLVRSQNVLSVLMQCFAICCIVSVIWVIYGYSLAFTGTGQFFGGSEALFLQTLTREATSGSLPESLFVIFQMTFAVITPALVVGAFAERMRFSAVCIFTVLWVTLVYLPACHMVWGGGYLAQLGVIDFAGGLVVHATCGVGALVVAKVIGLRKGFPGSSLVPHNRPMVVMGAAMLWVGWFGFNGGSQLALGTFDDAKSISTIFINTNLAACAGVMVNAVITRVIGGKTDVVMMLNGALGGLVAITAEPLAPSPFAAICIGGIGAAIVVIGASVLEKFKIDDVVGAIPVHLFAGIWGTLAVPITNADTTFATQFLGTFSVVAFMFIVSLVVWFILKSTVGIRTSDEAQKKGTDVAEIGVVAYAIRD